MYFDRAPGTFSGIARLVSPFFSQSGIQCEMEFYYYKLDSNFVSLGVYIVNDEDYADRLWFTSGSSNNNSWTRTAVGIYRKPNGFKIYFEGVQLQPGLSRLAIDDVSFKNCQTQSIISCSSTNVFRCSNGQCVSIDSVKKFNKKFLTFNI